MLRDRFLVLVFVLLLSPLPTVSADEEPAPPPMPEKLLQTLKWRCIGPFRGGRSCAVAGVPSERDTYYFGSTGGGVWKTNDGGRSWRNVSDGFFGGSIGSVAVSEWDPNVVYVGTGEKTIRGNVSSGDGVWKSLDAGKSWKHVGLADGRHVARVRVHPRDPDLVFAAVMGHLSGPNAERGVYRSKDGGESWERVLFVDDRAGAVDLCMDPTNPRVLYASTWRFLRTPFSLESGGEGSGVWKSADGGDTWRDITRNEGLPKEGPVGIAGVAVCPSRPERVYLILEHENGGVFRSEDGGDKWARVNDERALRQRAWYYTRIYADPSDADVVYVLNVELHRSKDGGKTFSSISVPHADNHDLWIDPHDPLRMIESNDGGANVSIDGGETWTRQDAQPTAQFYRVVTDDAFPYRIYGAQQDNSTVRILSRSDGRSIGPRDWEPTAGGESGHIAPHPLDPDVVYGGSYGGYLTRVNHRTGEARDVNVWPDNPMGWGAEGARYRFQWNFPIFFSPHDPNVLYAASNVLFRTETEGQRWEAISPDLTRDDASKLGPSGGPITKDNTSVEYYCTIFAALESPYEKDLLWTGSDDGLIHVSKNGGASWANVTPRDLPEWSQINSIETHPFEKGGLYVAVTRYKLDDFEPYLYRTTDYGKSWTRIDSGIDRSHFTRVVRADPERAKLLYAGTERGVYVSFDDGGRWQPLQSNLPITPVTDLAVKEGDLVAATQGRSFWILDDLDHLRQIEPSQIDEGVHLYRPEPVWRARGSTNGNSERSGENPPAGVVMRYLLKEKPKDDVEVALEILDPDGASVRRFSSAATAKETKDVKLEVKEGMNRVEWNLVHPGARSVDGMILWAGSLDGPRAIPGDYTVRLVIGGDERTTSFTLRKDPRSEASLDDVRAQFDFLIAARDKLTETHETILTIRRVRTQVNDVLAKLGDGEDATSLEKDAQALIGRLTKIEEALYQTKNQSSQDPLNFPIRLNDKLAGVANSVASGGDYRPTDQAVRVYEEIAAAIDAELATLRDILDEDLIEIESRIATCGVRFVDPSSPSGHEVER